MIDPAASFRFFCRTGGKRIIDRLTSKDSEQYRQKERNEEIK